MLTDVISAEKFGEQFGEIHTPIDAQKNQPLGSYSTRIRDLLSRGKNGFIRPFWRASKPFINLGQIYDDHENIYGFISINRRMQNVFYKQNSSKSQ